LEPRCWFAAEPIPRDTGERRAGGGLEVVDAMVLPPYRGTLGRFRVGLTLREVDLLGTDGLISARGTK
jgi:hypothetical protein